MHFEFFTHVFVRGSSTTFSWSQVRDEGLICCLVPGDTTSTDPGGNGRAGTRGPLESTGLWAEAQKADGISGPGEGSATRRPLVRQYDVPEKFIGVLLGDVVQPRSDALDEFLYGFDTAITSFKTYRSAHHPYHHHP
ncbi:hypothetical protein EVAR_79613_1 [Eumeta japonica]|uniref:Uncharacterized protein n=1 Tax=Eumeta variegata TaxID=151549 RepID=A0A4C1UFN1_EUMVA|nr:hypothetical protein EVAR_79613_1 [Eumeta japonica]